MLSNTAPYQAPPGIGYEHIYQQVEALGLQRPRSEPCPEHAAARIVAQTWRSHDDNLRLVQYRCGHPDCDAPLGWACFQVNFRGEVLRYDNGDGECRDAEILQAIALKQGRAILRNASALLLCGLVVVAMVILF